MSGYASSQTTPNIKGCWYLLDIEECPACGWFKEYRTRMLGPKPADWEDRVNYTTRWNGCEL